MKSYLLLLFCFLLLSPAFAQDVVVKVNGEEVEVKVLEISPETVLYQVKDSVDGKHLSIPRSEVFMVRFANGTKEVFQENMAAGGAIGQVMADPGQLYRLGQQDARLNKRKGGSRQSTASSGSYENDPNYLKGYVDETRRSKRKREPLGFHSVEGFSLIIMVAEFLLRFP